MKIGQLVMLIKSEYNPRDNDFPWPPIGSTGEVVDHCMGDVHVDFPHHPYPDAAVKGSWWHIPIPWLIPIDDPDAVKESEKQQDLEFGEKVKERIRNLERERDEALRELENLKC